MPPEAISSLIGATAGGAAAIAATQEVLNNLAPGAAAAVAPTLNNAQAALQQAAVQLVTLVQVDPVRCCL